MAFAGKGKSKMPEFNHDLFTKAVKWIFKKKMFSATMLSDRPIQGLLHEVNRVLCGAITAGITKTVPLEITYVLEHNMFVFSGFKVYHELQEASLKLTGDDGGFKPWHQFFKDVQAIDTKYNINWLRSEYNYAVQSTQMAVKWKEFEKDGDRYMLQYRTAGDTHVREDHKPLNKTTLPSTDKFWDSYFPPNGWGCRCTVVQVRKGKYKESNSDEAIRNGDEATKDPKQRMFRVNPGKTLNTMPPKHPYYPRNCNQCPFNNTSLNTESSTSTNNECGNGCTHVKKILGDDPRVSNRELYEKLKNDPNYIEVAYDEESGGVMACHRNHNFDKNKGDYERNVATIGYKNGHSVILEEEIHTIQHKRNTEGLWDGMLFEIAACETGKESNIRNALKHCASKPGCQIAILYFPNNQLDQNIVRKGRKKYKGLEGTSQYTEFRQIICIEQNGSIH